MRVEEIPKNVTIFVYKNCFRIYPYYKSRYVKETREVVGTCPKLDNMFLLFENYRGFINKKDYLGIYNNKEKTLTLPFGFGLEKIESKLYDCGIIYKIKDKTDIVIQPREVNFYMDEKYTFRNKYQAEAVEFLTSEKLGHTKMLALSTGIGKTICSVFGAAKLKEPIFIVSETLSDQWMEKITEYTDCTKNNKGIMILRGTDKINSLLNHPKEKMKSAFYISTSATLSSYLEKYGTLNKLYDHLGIGILCFDEYHMNWAQNMRIECDALVSKIWRLTATPSRTNKNENKLFERMLEKVPVYGLQTFTVNNHSNIRLVDYNTEPSYEEVGSCITPKGLSAILYWNYIFNDEKRKTYILGMVKMLLDPLIDQYENTKILIYLAKLEHIDIFKGLLESLYEKESKCVDMGNYTTKISNKTLRKRELKNRIVFTTIGSGGVGLDLENLVAVFSLVPYSSQITSSQMIGRLRFIEDKETYFYDFIDTGFKTMQRQRIQRMSIMGQKSKSITQKKISYEQVIEYLQDYL